jgi:hypothetical protein
MRQKLAWFVGLYAASFAVVAVVAWLLGLVISG